MSGLFGMGGSKVAAPVKQEVVKMPDRQDPKLLDEAARRRRKEIEEGGGGRDQTVLTAGEAVPYSNSDLGK